MNPDHIIELAVKPGGGLRVEGYPTAVLLGRLSSPAAHRLRQREIQSRALARLDASLQLLGNLIDGGFELPAGWFSQDVIDTLLDRDRGRLLQMLRSHPRKR